MLIRLLLVFALTIPATVYAEDGDTIWLDGRKIRLWGVDAPEHDQRFGKEAKDALAAILGLVEGCEHKGWSYKREVCLLHLRNGSTAQVELLRLGLVWIEPRYCKTISPCMAWKFDEGTAKAARLGLWADDDPTPPWVWRKRKRGLE